MEITTEAVVLFNLAVGMALSGWLFGKLWPQARREAFQQDLFRLRNDLFLFVAENGHSFDDRGYRFLRKKLNFMIRFAETFNIPTVLVTAFIIPNGERDPDLIDETENEALRNELKRVEIESARRVAEFLSWSILGAFGILVFQLIGLLRWKTTIPPEQLRPVRAFEHRAQHLQLNHCS